MNKVPLQNLHSPPCEFPELSVLKFQYYLSNARYRYDTLDILLKKKDDIKKGKYKLNDSGLMMGLNPPLILINLAAQEAIKQEYHPL